MRNPARASVVAFLVACGGGVAPHTSGTGVPGLDAGSPSACSTLAACCTTLGGPSQSLCNDVVGAGKAQDCSTELVQLQGEGECPGQMSGQGGGGSSSGGSSSSSSGNAPTGLAGFAFVVNGVVQTPMKCVGSHWEFPWVPGEAVPAGEQYPPLAGIHSVVIVNTGTLPMPYLAQSYWNGNAVPGGLTGQTYQLAGVLEPGQQVDITSVYLPGIVALLGSAEPFSSAAGGYAADEGSIPWPLGVSGSGGSATMYVAEIEVPYSPMSQCIPPSKQW
jgi:hypothetical protein